MHEEWCNLGRFAAFIGLVPKRILPGVYISKLSQQPDTDFTIKKGLGHLGQKMTFNCLFLVPLKEVSAESPPLAE